jgi:hypothetical protein
MRGRPVADNFLLLFIYFHKYTVHRTQVGGCCDGGFVRRRGTDFAHGFLGLSLCSSYGVARRRLLREGMKEMHT